MPRPVDMNHAVLRPPQSDPPLNELQRAEELIKREMILTQDCLESPTLGSAGGWSRVKKGGCECILSQDFMDRFPDSKYSKDEKDVASELLKKGMDIMKLGMQHSDLSLDWMSILMCGMLRSCYCLGISYTPGPTWPARRTGFRVWRLKLN